MKTSRKKGEASETARRKRVRGHGFTHDPARAPTEVPPAFSHVPRVEIHDHSISPSGRPVFLSTAPAESGIRTLRRSFRTPQMELEPTPFLHDAFRNSFGPAPFAEERTTDLKGVVLDGRYRVGEVLGEGGTSQVLEAERLSDGAPLVVKVLRDPFKASSSVGETLRREGTVARSVSHPGIANVIDEGALPDGSPYLVMERIHAKSLARLLPHFGILGVREACALTIRVAEILQAVHESGFVHRDVKPDHIFLAVASSQLQVHLLDFGASIRASFAPDESDQGEGDEGEWVATPHRYVVGTPRYMSPEQASGESHVDARSDLYSVGIVLYEMLSGRVPFENPNMLGLLTRVINEDAPRLALVAPRVGLRLDAVVMQAIARDRNQRFANASALVQALVPFAGDRFAAEESLMQMLFSEAALHQKKREA